MTAVELMPKVFTQLHVAICLQTEAYLVERLAGDVDKATRLRGTATLFVAHALKVMAVHRDAVEEWHGYQEAPPQWVSAIQ